MLDLREISVHLGGRAILDRVSLRIHARERVGIVGPNGTGKTTLFELIAGQCAPDHGDIQVPRDLRVGYLRQQFHLPREDISVLDYTENALATVRAIEHEISTIETSLADTAGTEHHRLLQRLGTLQTKFEALGGYELSHRAQAALCGLGFRAEELRRPLREFSGGWQMRAELARALIARPDLLLLDEPTNFLDLPAVEWLQRHLRDFAGTLLLISHDRYLLNALTETTVEIAGGRLTRYAGNYQYYARERELRAEQLEAAAANQDRKREQIERFIERFRSQASKASLVQSRVKMLEKMETIAAPAPRLRGATIRIPEPPACGAEVVRLEGAGVSYDDRTWVLRGIDLRVNRGDRIALVGYNGMGKTTLLRMLAGRLAPSEGKRVLGHHVVTGYQAQDFAEMMDADRTVLETLRAAGPDVNERELRTLLGGFLFRGDDVEKRVGVLSGGEKMRLAFARLLLNPPNFLLLDEPTTHLDIPSREALEQALQSYGGTLCIVSHDVLFVRRVATSIIAMVPPGIQRYAGGYDYYCEKLARDTATAEGRDGRSSTHAAGQDTEPADRKAARRERALQRESQSKKRRPLEKAIKHAEEGIARLEVEQQALLDELSRQDKPADYAGVNRRLGEIQAELGILMADWEKASLELENLP